MSERPTPKRAEPEPVEAPVARRLEQHLARETGRACRVLELAPLGGGACQESFRVVVALGAGEPETLVLRSDARTSLPGSVDRSVEHAVIGAAVAAGVRTPRARFLGRGLVREGAWAYLLDFVPGEALGRRVVAHPSLEGARRGLTAELARELAKIHSVAGEALPAALGPAPADPVTAALAQARAMLDRLRAGKRPVERPGLELAFAWLATHPPRDRAVTLVHGDFRVGNFLVTPAGLAAVLDWEFAHAGSPLEDLAWLCLRDWRFGRLDRAAGGIGSRDELLAAYTAAAGGRVVDRDDLRFHEILGNLRWAVGSLLQGQRALEGGETDLELLAVARRSGEMELEALRLVALAEEKS